MRQELKANAGLLFAGVLTFVLMGAGQSLYGPALPALARSFTLEVSQAGVLISAHWVGAAIGVGGMFLRGAAVRRWMALAAIGIGTGVMASVLSWGLTLIGAVVFGAGYGASTVIYNRRFLKGFGARGPAMVGFLNAVFGIGAIGAPLVFVGIGGLVALAYGLVAGLALLGAAVTMAMGRNAVTEEVRHGHFVLRPGILLLGALAIGVEASLIGLGPVALIAAGESETAAAEWLSLFFVAFLLVRLGLMAFSNLLPPYRLFMLALAGAGIAALGTALGLGWCFVALGACAGLFFPPFYVCASALMGDDVRVSPTIIAAGLVGGILSPLLLGGVMTLLGEAAFFWIIAGVSLGTAAAGAVLSPRLSRALA